MTVPDTGGADYAERMAALQGVWWKKALGVQLPYRWNVRRLLHGRQRILDVGCGNGRNLAHLGRGVGVDHNPDLVAAARAQGLTAWTTHEWPTSPDAAPRSYDALLLAHVLEHLSVEDADGVVRGYLPYLKDDARLVLICPQERGYETDPTHIRFLDFADLDRSARSWGFVPAERRSFPLSRRSGTWFPYNEFVLVADRAGRASDVPGQALARS